MLRYTVCILGLVAVMTVPSINGLMTPISPREYCLSMNRLPGLESLRYHSACNTTNPAGRCETLYCAITFLTDIPTSSNEGQAPDGLMCGGNKVCISGKCVADSRYSPREIDEFNFNCEKQMGKPH